ncbi:cytochrome b5 reductase 4 [Copidosoma floridanum]|uniref:cytochrome b5 reductase 4 n=1 Tax=Copidosoma floridanum TaxID=29053 RepID=UPI0006C969EA|nr:cytochrome b5 reductase 4 [Copidosoma floridanum]
MDTSTDALSPSKENEAEIVETTTAVHDGQIGRKIEPTSLLPPTSALAAPTVPLAKNLQPIGRVKQLRDSALKETSSIVSSGSATGNPRNKTALAPGHSLMDWIRLGSSGVDLTGVGGKLLTVTPAELAKHDKETDAWIAIRGIVFNVSRYLAFHPGGVPELMKGVGKDATKLFDDVHAWVNYQSILQKCVVGRLERSINADLCFRSDKDAPKNITNAAAAAKASAAVKLDWRQTSHSVSLFFTGCKPEIGPLGECQVRRENEREFALRIGLERSGHVTRYSLVVAEDVEWPPNFRHGCEGQEIELVFKKKNRGIWKSYGTHSASQEEPVAGKAMAKRTYNEYEVLENTGLCEAVRLLVLRARNYVQLVPAGRHVQAKLHVMGTEVSRPYTPVPSCLHPEDRPASATSDDCLCLMVKRYENGALSPTLAALRVGDKLELSNALGTFEPGRYDECSAMHLLAAGSGLTVMLAVVKRALARRSPPTINLVNFNRDEDNVFYARELERLAGEDKLKLTQVMSEAGDTWQGRRATLSEELLLELLGRAANARACVFTCGPPGFMKLARESLRNLGWERIYEFDG